MRIKRKQKFGKLLSMDDLQVLFPDEAAATAFVEQMVWADGKPICPKCGSDKSYRLGDRPGYRCSMCRKNFTVRVGTIFECSRLPLRTWLKAICLSQQHRLGISTRALAGLLGITQKASWFLMHRLRDVCQINFDKDPKLQSRTRIDEAYFGGKEPNKQKGNRSEDKQGGSGKQVVVGAVDIDGNMRVEVVPDRTKKSMLTFGLKHILGGTDIDSDLAWCYGLFGDVGYGHRTVNHSKGEHARGEVTTNPVENLWSLMKRGFAGVYGHCLPSHLQRYADEFRFRLTEGRVGLDSIDRMKAMLRRVDGHRLTYASLIRHPMWIHRSFSTGPDFVYNKNVDYGEPF